MEIRHNYRYVFALACMKQHCRKCAAEQLRRFIILQCKLCCMRLVSTRIVLNFLCCCFGYADGTVLSLVRVFVLVRSAANVFLRSPGVA